MFDHVMDLGAHEQTRLAAVLEACDGTYDPVQVLRDEIAAHELLYSNLDPYQQAVYDDLVRVGVFPTSTGEFP